MTQVGTPSQFQKELKVLVCCIAAYPSRPPGLLKLIESCEKFGVQLTIFGEGTSYINNYETKLVYLGNCIYNLRNQYDYVVSIDAIDTLFLKPLDLGHLIIRSIVFAGEKNCYPFEQLKDHYVTKGREYPYLNGGCFMATMNMAVLMFSFMKNKRMMEPVPMISNDFTDYYRCDQGAWSWEYLFGENVSVDYNARSFQTLCLVNQDEDLRIEDGKLFNTKTGTQPFILHANGSSDYQNIYEKIIKNG